MSDGLIVSLFVAGCVGLMVLAGIGAANQQSAFTVECEAAKPCRGQSRLAYLDGGHPRRVGRRSGAGRPGSRAWPWLAH